MLENTVALFKRLNNDIDFRTKFVSDRGFLFEHFYVNQDIDQKLYNQLRRDLSFTPKLIDDPSPLDKIFRPYKDQLASYPEQSPEEFFKSGLKEAQSEGDKITENHVDKMAWVTPRQNSKYYKEVQAGNPGKNELLRRKRNYPSYAR